MILDNLILEKNETLVGEENVRHNSTIKASKMAKLLHLLGNIYQDKYGTLPLEYLSNAVDSHIEKGNVDEPVVCELKKDINGRWYFAAIDYGVGISPDRIHNFNNYLDSTKEQEEDSIGSYGLGCKSYLAYTNKLFINTIFDGIKYTYLICQDAYGIPGIELLGQVVTEERNGTKVWFYLEKDSSGWNVEPESKKFYAGIKRRTAYFENLSYQIDVYDDLNKNKIYKAKNFWYSSMLPMDEMHLIIKNVPYKIDWQLIGLSRISLPIGLPIEGIFPMPTREGFYTIDSTKGIIIDAIQRASKEIMDIVNRSRTNITNWFDWYLKERETPTIELGGIKYAIGDIQKHSDTKLNLLVYPPLLGLNTYRLKYTPLPFAITGRIVNNRRLDVRNDSITFAEATNRNKTIYCVEGKYTPLKNKYLNSLHSEVLLCKRKVLSDKEVAELLYTDISADNFEVQKQQYLDFVDGVWSECKNYDNLVVPKQFIDSIKVARVKKVSNKPVGQITYYLLREAEKRSEYYAALDTLSTSDFDKPWKKMVVYGNKDDRKLLDSIFRCTNRKDVDCIIVADGNKKYLTSKQYVKVEEFKDTKTFSRVITAWKIKQLLKKNNCFVPRSSTYYDYKNYFEGCAYLSSEFKELITELGEYENLILKQESWNSKLDNAWLEQCEVIATEYKLWDYSVYHKIAQLESYFKRFEFVKMFKHDSNWKDVAKGYIKYVTKNIKLDLAHYQTIKNNINEITNQG